MPLIHPETGELGHFWSIDGSQCLWCRAKREPEEIAAWVAAGEPWQKCERGEE